MAKYPCRLLSTGFNDAYYNMGLDEALLESVAAAQLTGSDQAVLRFYGWDPPAVSVGYSQSLADEVDIASARRHGFDIVRRVSGGGAVLHKSELTYSIILPLDHPLAGGGLDESYRILCWGLISGFSFLGIDAVFSGTNDILAGGRKISGNAQTRRLDCLLQHGTVLLSSDVEAMFEVLKVPKDIGRGRSISEAKKKVSSLSLILGREVPYDEAETAVTMGFSRALGLDLVKSRVNPGEETRAHELASAKFKTREWVYQK